MTWMTDTPPALDGDDFTPLDVIEAEVRRRMATVTKARGFDSQRERDDEIGSIDALLDRWNDLRQLFPTP